MTLIGSTMHGKNQKCFDMKYIIAAAIIAITAIAHSVEKTDPNGGAATSAMVAARAENDIAAANPDPCSLSYIICK